METSAFWSDAFGRYRPRLCENASSSSELAYSPEVSRRWVWAASFQGADRRQPTLLPECLDDYVAEDNPVRVVDVFVDELDLRGLGFRGYDARSDGPSRPITRPCC